MKEPATLIKLDQIFVDDKPMLEIIVQLPMDLFENNENHYNLEAAFTISKILGDKTEEDYLQYLSGARFLLNQTINAITTLREDRKNEKQTN